MTHEQAHRQHLARILDWEDAHVSFDRAVDGIPAAKRGVLPPGLQHSAWQLLEHIRLTQWDILDFCVNPRYVEPSSMEEYWPPAAEPPDARAWGEGVKAVKRDRDEMKRIALDTALDLFARIPHGSGQTYLREMLLVADNTAYHVGQIVLVRMIYAIACQLGEYGAEPDAVEKGYRRCLFLTRLQGTVAAAAVGCYYSGKQIYLIPSSPAEAEGLDAQHHSRFRTIGRGQGFSGQNPLQESLRPSHSRHFAAVGRTRPGQLKLRRLKTASSPNAMRGTCGHSPSPTRRRC